MVSAMACWYKIQITEHVLFPNMAKALRLYLKYLHCCHHMLSVCSHSFPLGALVSCHTKNKLVR